MFQSQAKCKKPKSVKKEIQVDDVSSNIPDNSKFFSISLVQLTGFRISLIKKVSLEI